jgi:hypothetical protein
VLARLGHVLGWTANIIAVAILGVGAWLGVSTLENPFSRYLSWTDFAGPALCAVFGATFVYAIGRVLRYIFAG